MYYVIIIGLVILSSAILIYIIKNALNVKKGGSEYNKNSILLKILMNYFQLVAIVSNF